MYLENLRSALEHDVPILAKMASTPLGPWQGIWDNMEKDAAGEWGSLFNTWRAPMSAIGGASSTIPARWGATKMWAKNNPAHGMGLGLVAGLILPRLMNMFQNLTNPQG